MSLILRLRQRISTGFLPKPYILPSIGVKPQNPSWACCRSFAQAAARQEDEDEVVDIDPRKLPADYDPSNFDPTCHRNPPSASVFRLVDEVSSLTLREAAELGSILMKKMGVTEAPVIGVLKPGAVAGLALAGGEAAAGAGAQEEKKEEKTVFELKLESFETSAKIKVIKEIRACTQLGLKEAKELVEKTPAVFRTGVSKEEGEQIAEKLKAVGAKVVLE